MEHIVEMNTPCTCERYHTVSIMDSPRLCKYCGGFPPTYAIKDGKFIRID